MLLYARPADAGRGCSAGRHRLRWLGRQLRGCRCFNRDGGGCFNRDCGGGYSNRDCLNLVCVYVCSGQTYALCAVASCFVLDDVAYCKCDVLSGDSISLSDAFGNGQNICSVNAEGAENGYMASTFSLPDSVVAPGGSQALYTCPASTSTGAYAQCDGGLCFTSTEGQSFPGFSEPLTDGEIICSCPITLANPATAMVGYQIAGPYPCQKSFFQNCKRATASKKNGSQIYVGAPTGVGGTLDPPAKWQRPDVEPMPSVASFKGSPRGFWAKAKRQPL